MELKKEKIKKEKKKWSKKKKVIVTAVGVCLLACACSGNTEDKKEAVETTTDVAVVEDTELVVDVAPTEIDETEEKVRKVVTGIIGKDNLMDLNYVPDTEFILVRYYSTNSLNSEKMHIFNMLKELQSLTDYSIDFNIMNNATDTSGNTETIKILQAEFSSNTIQNINFPRSDWRDIDQIADGWWKHNSFN